MAGTALVYAAVTTTPVLVAYTYSVITGTMTRALEFDCKKRILKDKGVGAGRGITVWEPPIGKTGVYSKEGVFQASGSGSRRQSKINILVKNVSLVRVV